MSLETMRKYVEARIGTFVEANIPEFEMRYSNIKSYSDEVVNHIELTILDGASRQMEITERSPTRHAGVLQIDVLVPENTGTSLLYRTSETLGAHFRRLDVALPDRARLVTRDPAYRYFGVGAGYARMVVSIGYWREEKM